MKKSSFRFLIILTFFASVNAFAQFEVPKPNLPKLDFRYQPHPMIQQFIYFYQGRGRQTMEKRLVRSGQFSEMMRRIFREEKVPESLVVMYRTSDFDSTGFWFFDDKTAEKYNLRRTRFIDETRSPEKATRAAARHLKFLAEKYEGNWELAIAAYDAGEREVDRAVRRAQVKDFWLAYPYLAREMRNFVPNVLASALIENHREFFGFKNVQPDAPLAYDLIRLPPSISLSLIAQFSGSNRENIRRLNPELISAVSPPQNYIVRLPAGKANIFRERLNRYLQDRKTSQNNKSSNR